jgi:hypothetical protein
MRNSVSPRTGIARCHSETALIAAGFRRRVYATAGPKADACHGYTHCGFRRRKRDSRSTTVFGRARSTTFSASSRIWISESAGDPSSGKRCAWANHWEECDCHFMTVFALRVNPATCTKSAEEPKVWCHSRRSILRTVEPTKKSRSRKHQQSASENGRPTTAAGRPSSEKGVSLYSHST